MKKETVLQKEFVQVQPRGLRLRSALVIPGKISMNDAIGGEKLHAAGHLHSEVEQI
jgi:hypothetical protein